MKLTSEKWSWNEVSTSEQCPRQWVTSPILQHLRNDQSSSVITCTLDYLSVCLTYASPLPFFFPPGSREVLRPDRTFDESPADLSGKNVAAHLTEIGWGSEKHLDGATCNICLLWHQTSAQKTFLLKSKNLNKIKQEFKYSIGYNINRSFTI